MESHSQRRKFFALVRKRAREPLEGSLVSEFVKFLEKFRGISPNDERLSQYVQVGRLYLDKHPAHERLSKSTLAVAGSVDPGNISLPSEPEELGESVTEISKRARNTRRSDYRTTDGIQVARVVVARLHGARCLARIYDRVGGYPPNIGIDGAGSDILEEGIALVLLQDSEDRGLQEIIRRVSSRIVGKRSKSRNRSNGSKKELLENLMSEYLADPPDYLVFFPSRNLDEIWSYFYKAIERRFERVFERYNREIRKEREPAPRTKRYRKQKDIPEDGPVPPGYRTRAQVAEELETHRETLRRLEIKGLLKPEKTRSCVLYSPFEFKKAQALLEK